jgi:hypothetical protein
VDTPRPSPRTNRSRRVPLAGAEEPAGNFSLLELASGAGYSSRRLAAAFPRATVVSVEQDRRLHRRHVDVWARALEGAPRAPAGGGVAAGPPAAGVGRNNAPCLASPAEVAAKLFEAPEFFRFIVAPPLAAFIARADAGADADADAGAADGLAALGKILSCGMTSFLVLPSPRLLTPPLVLSGHAAPLTPY